MDNIEASRKEEEIRQAYASAHFDERTPDEKGFAAVFEERIKPRLVESVGFNLRAATAQRFRRRVAGAGLIVAFFGLFFAGPLLSFVAGEFGDTLATLASFIAIGLLIRWGFNVRPEEKDSSHAAAMDEVLQRFGVRLGREAALHHPVRGGSPVVPLGRITSPPEHLYGRFDDRIDFTAVRVKTEKKEGKSTLTHFLGWYLRVDLPFAFPATTVIRERAALLAMPTRGVGGLQTVELEDPAFHARYAVVSTDQVEARVVLPPDVIHHLAETKVDKAGHFGGLALALHGSAAHLWLPSNATALADWRPLDPAKMIEDFHEAFAELAAMRDFLRDIDVIAEHEGFRLKASKNA